MAERSTVFPGACREAGFYWVRGGPTSNWIVAEYLVETKGRFGVWCAPGWTETWPEDFAYDVGPRLEPPAA